MDKAGPGSESAATTAYNTVFIGTNLETHLAMIVPDSDTVFDLKKKIVYEHTLCFPNIGEIKVHALKVKRRGCFYYLSDLMPVKSAFEGVSKSWFLSVDASSVKGQKDISHCCKPDSRNKAAHFDIANNNDLADVVDLLPDVPSRRLSNIDDSLLLQVVDKKHQEQNPIAEQFGSRNSSDELSEVLHKKVERLVYNNPKDSLFTTSNRSGLQLQDKCDVHGKEFEDPRTHVGHKDTNFENGNGSVGCTVSLDIAPKDGSVAKKRHNTEKRNEDASKLDIIVPVNSFEGARRKVSDNINEKNQHIGSSRTNNESGIGMRTTRTSVICEVIQVLKKQFDCENDKSENDVFSRQKLKSPEESVQFGSPAKKRQKIKKTGDYDSSLIDHGESTSDAVKGTSRQQEMTTSNYSLHKNLDRGIAISENTELLGDSHKLTDTAIGKKRKRKEQASDPCQVVGVISSEKEVEETSKLPRSIEDDVSNTGVGSGESKNEAADSEAALVKDANLLVDQHAGHVEDHSSPMIQEPSNLRESGVTGHENQTVELENGTVEVGKSLRKRKKSRKAQGPDVETSTASGAEHLRESRSKAGDLEAVPMKDTIMLVDHHVSHVEDPSSPMIQEPRSLWEITVTGHENQTVVVEDEIVEAGKSLRKRNKSRKAQGLAVETSIPSGTEHLWESLGDVSPTEPPISDKAEKSGSTELKGASKMKMVSATPADDKGPDEVIQDVLESLHILESLHQYSKCMANQGMDEELKKKTKKKRSSTLVENVETKKIDDLDNYNPKTSTDNVRDVNLLAESSKETMLVNTTSMNKLNRSKESQNNAEVEGNLEILPLQDIISKNCPAINYTNDDNEGINVSCEDDRIKNQPQNESIASTEKLVDKVTDKRAADSKAKAMKKKKMLDLPSTGPSPNLQRSVMSSHSSGGDAQVTSSERIQNQRPSLKSVNESDRVMVQSNKKLPTISLNREKLSECNESETLVTPEEARTPIATNSSNIRTHLKFTASTSSSMESYKGIVNKNKSSNGHQSHLTVKKAQRNGTREVVDSSERKRGLIVTSGRIDERGNESRSHVAIRKAQSNNNGEVVDSSDRKRSLLAMSSTIFKDDGKESSDDEDKTDNSDASTRTPSDKSSSSESSDSDADSSPSEHGSYSSKGQGSSGRNKKSLPSSPRSMPLEVILRSSTRYKRAKLTFSQSQYNDTESQPDDFVPDRQRK